MAGGRHIPEGVLARAVAVILLAPLAIGGPACGLFEARDPVEPGNNQFTCAPLIQQDNVFSNILAAYGKGEGLACYSSLLDPAFSFQPDPADLSEAPAGQYDNWTKDVEQQVTQNVAAGAQRFTLQYTGAYEPVSITPDVEIRRYPYEIDFRGTLIPDTLFQGIAEVTITRSNAGLWQITSWVDRRDPGGTTTRTWGYLRGAFRIGI